jgi:hypothetical protein
MATTKHTKDTKETEMKLPANEANGRGRNRKLPTEHTEYTEESDRSRIEKPRMNANRREFQSERKVDRDDDLQLTFYTIAST